MTGNVNFVSIIIPVFDDIAISLNCMHFISLNTEADTYEVITACNNADPFEYFNKFNKNKSVFNMSGNIIEGLNLAAKEANGEYLAFLDPNIEVQPNWLNALLKAFNTKPYAGAVNPKVIGPHGLLLEAGGSTLENGAFNGRGQGSHPYLPQYDFVCETKSGSRFYLFLKKRTFLEAGMLDTRFQDIGLAFFDVSLTLREQGRVIFYQPHSTLALRNPSDVNKKEGKIGFSVAKLQELEAQGKEGKKQPRISVILPTFNRAKFLMSSLQSLINQGIPKEDYEVIVIDDGSQDNTHDICMNFSSNLPLRYYYQENSGISVAKNHGISVSSGNILFFFDDDDVASQNLLYEHLMIHERNPEENSAVLGYTTWHPSLRITEVMHFITDIGQYLFSYKDLEDGQILDFRYFWGGRTSCKKSFLLKYGIFNEQFRFGSEDIELGYRLSKHGLKVIYNRKAVSYMLRPITYDDFCRRCERQGRSQFYFSLLHKDPVIQQWCQVIMAKEKWQCIKNELDKNVQSAIRIEKWLEKTEEAKELLSRAKKQKNRNTRTVNEARTFLQSHLNPINLERNINCLRRLYYTTFDSFKIKGIVEAMDAFYTDNTICCSDQFLSQLSKNDLDIFRNKHSSLPDLKQKKNILFIDVYLPMYDRASGSLRAFHILKSLVSMGYHVTFISKFSKHSAQYVPVLQELGIEVYAGDPIAAKASNVLEVAPHLDMTRVLKDSFYETAILSFWTNAEYYLPIIRMFSPKSKIIVDTVDVVFVRKIREAELKGDADLLSKAVMNKRREINLYKKADRLWVVTDNDREAIENFVDGVPIDIVPNIHAEINTDKSFENTRDLLFVGNFWHIPNIDAMEYFLSIIFPIISSELPSVKINIVGDNVPETLRQFSSEKIIFTGYVEDLSQYLENARISVAPLRYGAGMKGKIGEALSWGLPAVTTTIGAEGMNLIDGYNIMIADTPEEFAQKVIRLYNDKNLWESLSVNGKITASENWSPQAVSKKLEVAMSELKSKEALKCGQPTAERCIEIEAKPIFQHDTSLRNAVSIIILTLNELEYTKRCIESIRKHTPETHEIIFVDNGSTDGTMNWLQNLVQEHNHYKLIENPNNLGFPKGCNQGIQASSGEYILLLNNDVIVTDGWLSGMLECLNSASDVGIVGPMTNNISGVQKVQDANDESLDCLDEYARKFRELNRYRRVPVTRVVGFCMLFERKLVEKIGLLDESFGSGNFEDDDYCLRAAIEGYRNIIAGDVFIHHYGSRSFIGNMIDYNSAMSKNKKIFYEKWSGINTTSLLGKKLFLFRVIEKADHLNQQGMIENASDKLLKGIKHSPDDKSVYFILSEMLIASKQYKDALDVLHEMPVDDKDIKGLTLMGYCEEGLKHYQKAEKCANQVLSFDPKYALALNLKGILEYRKGNNSDAEDFFQKAIASDHSYGEPYTNLGVLKWSNGQSEKALNLMEKGFILSPPIMDIAILYHSAVTSLHEFERAEKILKAAKDLFPFNKRIAFLLIDILIQQGKHTDALYKIQEAMIKFGIDGGILDAALEVCKRIEEKEKETQSKNKTILSLCMIVKNEEEHLMNALFSINPLVDEIIVVDTGSTDRTKDIAKIFGAKVYDFEWTDDFSKARNFSISKASGKWLFILDADEVISPQDYHVINEVVRRKEKNIEAYSFVTRNYVDNMSYTGWTANDGRYPNEERGTGWFSSKKVRLFKHDSHIYFENPVHELVEPSLRKTGIKIKECMVPIHHYGKLNTRKIITKGQDYYSIGKMKLNDKNNDVESLFELAVQAMELKKYNEAIELWQKFLALKTDIPKTYLTTALLNAGSASLRLAKYEEALLFSEKAIALAPELKEAVVNYALSELYIGDVKKVIGLLETQLLRTPEYVPAIALLSSSYYIDGNKEKGRIYMEYIKKKGINCTSYLSHYAKRLASIGKIEQATSLLDAIVESGDINKHIPASFQNVTDN
jgi:GT2 family glycosyltransferase/glycosyltransferase involved in cell wall biosynthesis